MLKGNHNILWSLVENSKNYIWAVILSIGVMLLWKIYYLDPQAEQQRKYQEQLASEQKNAPEPVIIKTLTRAEALSQGNRANISNDKISGSVNLKGFVLDDIALSNYENEPLLSPKNTEKAYYIKTGWLGNNISLPNGDSIWQQQDADNFTYNNNEGLVFGQNISLDKDYKINITSSITNNSNRDVTLYPYAMINRSYGGDLDSFMSHEGLVAHFDETLEEEDFVDIQDAGKITYNGTNGWLGFSDKYWLTSLMPQGSYVANVKYYEVTQKPRYQLDYRLEAVVIPAGGVKEITHSVFVGAKEEPVLSAYEEKFNLPMFDKTIDFGWFYFITKPLYKALKFFYDLVGNYGVAIILLTLLVRGILFPLTFKSYKSMAKLKEITPEMKRLRETYKSDRQKLNHEMMALYKKKGVNPAAGCLPVLLQLPIFFSIYKVLSVSIDVRHQPFFGWIKDLSAPDPTSIFNLFGLLPYEIETPILMIGVLPILVGLSMWWLQKFNPAPTDNIQRKIAQFLPFLIVLFSFRIAAGVVLYWICSNLVSILQQAILRR